VLVVNVASKCGLTPQYTGLEELQHLYAERGFTVLGVPCNQFGGQEPGTAEEISSFCSSTYGVTFPITEKVDVNGQRRHPLFTELETQADATGDAGDILWNFEKFLVSPAGEVVGRFRPPVAPDADELVRAIEAILPSSATAPSSDTWKAVQAQDVKVGDTVRTPSGAVVLVSRIEAPFFGRSNMVAFVEDTPDRWFKQPVASDSEVEVRA
jgi:glutathione peroxidase